MRRRSLLLRALLPTALLTTPLLVLASAAALPSPVPNSPAVADDQVLATAAAAYRLERSDLQVTTRTTVRLPVTGVSVVRAKIFDRSTTRTYDLALDNAGRRLDLAQAQKAESKAYRARYATMSPDLAQVIAASAPDRTIEVGFWLRSSHDRLLTREGIDRNASEAQVRAVEAQNLKRVQEAVAKVIGPFVADLRRQGHQVILAGPLSPAVFARVAAGKVEDLAGDPRVQRTYYAGRRLKETQDIAKRTTAATTVWDRAFTGASQNSANSPNVGVVECCDSLFEENVGDLDAENNSWLARIHEGRASACGGDHSHPTAVSGIIGSTHPLTTGIGYNGRIYFNSACNGSEADVVAAAQNVGANVNGAMNHSYGAFTGSGEPCPGVTVLGTLAATLDNLVRAGADSQYVAAGNDGNAACVGSPANAWNVVAVGAWDDRNTTSWSGDIMAGFSSAGDPGSNDGDRSKPEVAGPGVNFTGLLPSPGGGPRGSIGSGTSYATPVYVGGAALAGQRRPFLAAWPETEKAVMMASSCHNIEGNQTNSELDGAGGPDFGEMDLLLANNRFRGDVVSNGSGVAITQSFPGVAVGEEMRVALGWDTNTSYSLYATDPSDDLDLILKRPDGTVAAASSSFDNTHEVIEFTANQAGTWTIEVDRFRTSDPAGSTFAGLAWHKYPPSACTAP